jgi:AcrR family transcriptional regulator
LFCTRGFSASSTYAICELAGVTQASMYHYFANKHQIALQLLMDIVRPSVDFARLLDARSDPPFAQLWALSAYDARLLASHPRNTGLLYVMPEIADPQFDPFRAERDFLINVYRELVRRCGVEETAAVDEVSAMVVALVESVGLLRRNDDSLDSDSIAGRVADTAVRLAGVPDALLQDVRRGGALLRDGIQALVRIDVPPEQPVPQPN